MKLLRVCLVILLASTNLKELAWAQDLPAAQNQQIGDNSYEKPHLFDFLTKTPADIRDVTKNAFRKENLGTWAWVTAATGVLIIYDQRLINHAQRLGTRLGISHTNYQKTFARIGVPLLNKDLNIEGPFDSGSSLYFIGDGWVDVVLIGGFLGTGLATNDNRALQTSSQITESILASGIVVQTLKHVTGRESPFTTDVSGGVWRFFPNQLRYSQHVPEFDAFPSGHLAAAMATVTVIGENYPEYRFVRPVGYSLMTVLGFQMMNNGVHWASDYPLAIVMGYSFGHMAVKNGRKKKNSTTDINFFPYALDGGGGILMIARFKTA